MSDLSSQQWEYIDREYANGMTAINIAKNLKIGKGRVFKYLQETNQIRKGGFKKQITVELEQEIVESYRSGKSTSEVASIYKLGQSTVVGIISKYGISRSLSESHTKYSDETKREAINMYIAGHSLLAACKLLEIRHPSSIEKWLKDEGIPLRSRSDAAIGSNNHYMRGRTGEDHPLWKGGISYAPYCEKFNAEFKCRVRAFFGNKCVLCDKSKEEEGRNLQVHHIHYNKQSCCDDKAPREFIVLCNSCHMKTNHNREFWEEYFTNLIATRYNGKSYYTKDEYYGN